MSCGGDWMEENMDTENRLSNIEKRQLKFFLLVAYGFTFYLFYNYWLSTFHPLAILIAPILKGIQYIPLFLCLKAADRLFARRSYIVQTLVYVAYLYLTQQGFIGYPYGNLSSAITQYTVLLQTADTFGIWGISFLMTAGQSLCAKMISSHAAKAYYCDFMVVLAVYLAFIIYGLFAIWHYEDLEPERVVRIAAVQHSADSWEGGDATYRRNLDTLTAVWVGAFPTLTNPVLVAHPSPHRGPALRTSDHIPE